MELSEGGRRYLENYYLLEQTRNEIHAYLERLAERLAVVVEDHLNSRSDAVIRFHKWVQKGGGNVHFILAPKSDVPELSHIKSWTYNVGYNDAMRTQSLEQSTDGVVFGFTPKAKSRQQAEIRRTAEALGQPDPYRRFEVPLLENPLEDTASSIARVMIEYCEEFTRIVEAARNSA